MDAQSVFYSIAKRKIDQISGKGSRTLAGAVEQKLCQGGTAASFFHMMIMGGSP